LWLLGVRRRDRESEGESRESGDPLRVGRARASRARRINASARHSAAALGTAAAGIHAFLHVAELLAVSRALLTDLCAFGAGVLVVWSVDQHEMRRGPADLGARHHQSEMLWLNVLTASLEAVCHRHPEAHLIAAQAFLDAVLHVTTKLMHLVASDVEAWRVLAFFAHLAF
jgi:hypothetical protein